MRDLLIVLPSRGRPQNMRRLLKAMEQTCRAETDLAVGLDAGDPQRLHYPEGPEYVVRNDLERMVIRWINALAMPRLDGYRAVGHFGDDCVPRTAGWDAEMLRSLEKTPLAFGNDLADDRPPGALCTHLFMRSETVRAMGYFAPPCIQHMWADLAWMAWGEAAGITYRDDVVIEHMHFLPGKAEQDVSYHLSRGLLNIDRLRLHEYVKTGLPADIRKLVPGHPGITLDEFYENCRKRGMPVPRPDEDARVGARKVQIWRRGQ